MLRRRVLRAPASSGRNVVLFALGDRRFAVPAAQIVEVVPIAGVAPVPSEDPANLGVTVHREELLPVVDLGPRLGLPGPEPVEPGRLCLFVRTGGGTVGVPVDRVLGFASAETPAEAEIALLDLTGLGGPYG